MEGGKPESVKWYMAIQQFLRLPEFVNPGPQMFGSSGVRKRIFLAARCLRARGTIKPYRELRSYEHNTSPNSGTSG